MLYIEIGSVNLGLRCCVCVSVCVCVCVVGVIYAIAGASRSSREHGGPAHTG